MRPGLHGKLRRWAFRVAVAVASVLLVLLGVHWVIERACHIERPPVGARSGTPQRPKPGLRVLGRSSVVERAGLFEVHLEGDPEAIGDAHVRLLYPEMVENEGILLTRFREAVPFAPFRTILLDLAQLRYRQLADGMSADRKRELSAGALAFSPDPYAAVFPTFQRFVYLNGLYDISLSFEHSPLIGCTSFAFAGKELGAPGALLARAFDFEVDPIFDRKKAVFFVRETGKIPFASVAWPGLVGVVSGMNEAGLAVVVHGGRAGEAHTRGEPVVHALRAVLSNAATLEQALVELRRRPPLVSHILVLADASGRTARVERVPGATDHVVPLGDAAAVTNHFHGPHAADPKNRTVLNSTSSAARKARADELVSSAAAPVTPDMAVQLLRDRRGAGGRTLELGDRDAIDALIATHGVVFQTHERRLWVSLGPHLLGAFVAFDLSEWLSPAHVPDPERKLPTISADPLGQHITVERKPGEWLHGERREE
jgi:isopenicillin-N N-acyltransferase like protein